MVATRKLTLAAGSIFLLAGCGAGADIGTNPNGNFVTFAFATPSGSGGGGAANGMSFSAGAEPETYTDGQNTLTITKVEIVIGEFLLQRLDECDTNPDATGCTDFKIGPLLVDVPLGGLARQFTVDVEMGTYYGVEMEVYKASSDNPADADFIAANPHMDGNSLRIEGTFNGTAFTFTTDLNAHQGFFLEPPVTIDETKMTTNMTIVLNLDRFFVDGAGMFVDPLLANEGGEFESMIEQNIVGAMKAFEDADEDGDDEH